MRRLFVIPLIVVLAVALIMSGCTKAATTTTQAPATTPPATTTTATTTTTTTAPPRTTTTTAPPVTTTTTAPPVTTAAAKPTGTIRVATPDFTYESTDPIFYESFWGWAMYDSLITFDQSGNYIPNVAESWTISPDGLTWTFKIRRGIKFHNGDPLTAQDVKFTVDRFASVDSTNPWSPYLRNNLDSTTVTDDYTFLYKSKTPEPPLVIPFSWTRILPKAYFQRVGQDEFRKHPIGSGPWKFVEMVPETRFKAEANTDYWGQVPSYQYFLDLQVPEEATRITLLKTGDVDIALGISTDRLIDLRDKSGFKTQIIGEPTLYNISFPGTGATGKPTKDIRVRQALSYAINRQEISTGFYRGLARPGGRWFMAPGDYGWDNSWQPEPYDLNKAKQLLKDAGYPSAFSDPKITYYVSGPSGGVDQAQLLQSYWKAAGIAVDIQIIDSVQWGGMFFVRNTAPTAPNVGNIFPWIFASTPNATYHSSNMYTSAGVHSTGNDPKADQMYKDATSELDPTKARQKWTDFRTYVETLYYNVGIVMIDSNVLVNPTTLGEFSNKAYMSLQDALNFIKKPK